MSELSGSGVPMVHALEIVSKAAGNDVSVAPKRRGRPPKGDATED